LGQRTPGIPVAPRRKREQQNRYAQIEQP